MRTLSHHIGTLGDDFQAILEHSNKTFHTTNTNAPLIWCAREYVAPLICVCHLQRLSMFVKHSSYVSVTQTPRAQHALSLCILSV